MLKKGLLVKNLLFEIWKTRTRYLSIFAISALGVAFFAGIRATSPDMKDAGDALFNASNLSDITVMSTAGLTPDDIEALRGIEGVEAVSPGLFVDAMMRTGGDEEKNVRLLSMPIQEKKAYGQLIDMLPSYDINPAPEYEMNALELKEGRLPVSDKETALDVKLQEEAGIALGDYVTFETSGGTASLRVVGFVYSPKYVSVFERGLSTIGNGNCAGFAYASGNALTRLGTKLPILGLLSTVYTEADIVISGKEGISAFSDAYEALVDAVSTRIEAYAETTSGTWYIQDRTSNPGYSDYSENTERIAAVGDVFPVIFFIVAALVSLTTMTRMVEEQRIEMGTLKALGYSTAAIMMKYVVYSISACVLGGFLGAVIGFWLLPYVIISAYSIMYRLPSFATPYRVDIASVAIIAAMACTGLATIAASASALREVPATLMRPKAPKAGKRVLLERAGFIWKRLNFTMKVTVRNIFRYKKRFFMSVIGIAGSCSLLVTGFGIQDSIFGIAEYQFNDIWKMDIQAYTYDSMPLEELQNLAADSEASSHFRSVMFCYDTVCDAESGDARTGNVHVLGVREYAEMEGKIRLHSSGTEVPLTDGGAVITKKLAELTGVDAGDTLRIYSGAQAYDVLVAGIADNYVYHYVYMTAAYYEQVFGKPMEYNAFMVNLDDNATEGDMDAISEALLTDSRVYTVMTLTSIYDSIMDSLSILDYIVIVLIAGSALLTFVVMLNLTNINLGERKRELATLRVLGFYDKEMYDYVFRENNALAAIGAAAGLVLGKFMHAFVIRTCEVDMVMFVRSANAMSFVYSFVLTVVFSLCVNLMMRRKVRAIDMVESLKSAE